MEVTTAEHDVTRPGQRTDMTSLYETLGQSKDSVEEIVAKMLAIKKEAQPKSQLRELITQILLNFVTLRQANRSILLEEDSVKAETLHAKASVELTTLQLQSLLYEKNHLVKAIRSCKEFDTEYPGIELVPQEEFFRDAPEDIKNSVLSKDSKQDLMLKRLNFELFQRKESGKLHKQLEQQKKALQETVSHRKKFLSSLPSHLKSLKKASLSVQQQLGVLHVKKLKQQQLAELLPPALYVIYSQLLTLKEVFGENIDLELTGSVKDAQDYTRQIANKDTGINSNSDYVSDDGDDGPRSKRSKNGSREENLDQSGIYEAHPLKISLHINDDDTSNSSSRELIVLNFEYLIKLNVVCVGVECSDNGGPEENILCNLFPDDDGLELPHQSAKLIIGDSCSFLERTSRPYKWVQHLAGIDFLPEVSPLFTVSENSNNEIATNTAVLSSLSLYRQQNRVQTIIQRVRAQRKAQLVLA